MWRLGGGLRGAGLVSAGTSRGQAGGASVSGAESAEPADLGSREKLVLNRAVAARLGLRFRPGWCRKRSSPRAGRVSLKTGTDGSVHPAQKSRLGTDSSGPGFQTDPEQRREFTLVISARTYNGKQVF